MTTSKGEMIAFRLDAERQKRLEYIVISQNYENKSAAIRDAIDLLIHQKLGQFGSKRATIELTEDTMSRCNELSALGAGTLSEIAEKALEAYCKTKYDEIEDHTRGFQKLLAKVNHRRVTEKQLRDLAFDLDEP